MIKEYYSHYLGKKETNHATKFQSPIGVYKSDEIKKKLKTLLEAVRNARRSIMDFEKDFDDNKDKQQLLSNLKKVEQSIAEVEKKVFSDFD